MTRLVDITFILKFYIRLVKEFSVPWLDDRSFIANFTEITRSVWFPTLHVLREMGKSRTGGAARVLWEDAVQIWTELGRAVNLDEKNPEDRNPVFAGILGRDGTPIAWQHKTCSWAQCLCNVGPAAHPMRVCKRCWRALYCSKTCQKRYARISCRLETKPY